QTGLVEKCVHRDEWMTFDFLTMRTTSTAEKRAEKERLKEEESEKARVIEQAGLHKLELNPFWKDGGSGLPPEKTATTVVKKAAIVDDGGLGWLRKSYQRMKEQAEREQRSLETIVAERYGSMEMFQRRMEEAEMAVYGYKRGDLGRGDEERRNRWRGERDGMDREDLGRGDEERRNRWRGEREGMDREDRGRVDEEGRERWRRGDERGEGGRPDKGRIPLLGGEMDSEKVRGRDRQLDGGRDRETLRDGRRVRERERDGGRQGEGDGNRRERDGGRPTDRDKERDGGRQGDGDGNRRRERDEGRDRERPRERDRDDSHGSTLSRSQPPVSLGSLKSRFLKPADDDDYGELGQTEEDQEVLLFRTDQSGHAWPVSASSEPQEPRGGRRKKKAIETHRDGERVRYFQDDDGVDLKEMVRREKMSTAEDQNSLYARMAGKMMGKADGDNYTLDDMFVSSVAQREGEGQDEERMRSRAIAEHRRLAVTMEKCHHCFSNPELQKHLLIAIGTKVYLSLPAGVSLTEGHCLIAPLQHHCSATGLDEDVWTEIQAFRKALVQMFENQDQDCVFMETHMNVKRRQHMVLECIPLPRELGDMAPIYFKKALMECDEEWAMNKKVVDLSSKDIRHAVPRGLPYFSVDFGLQGGFAHVIENEHKFPHYFGKEIVGGMLDVEPRIWRKSIRENFDDQRKKVLEFSQWWKPFDCTKTGS
uniref:CWF19-like protein 2 n=1 Tax=Esox lucius TaxID=8010 RepID=A0A3P8ZY04_ESOLU